MFFMLAMYGKAGMFAKRPGIIINNTNSRGLFICNLVFESVYLNMLLVLLLLQQARQWNV